MPELELNTEQRMPVPNDSPSVQGMVRADLETRELIGRQRYGTALQPHNGRDALRDLYEELLDACCYIRQAIAERDTAAVSVDLEDARRIFDLAVDSPLICSGSFESDDVAVLRRIAGQIGADPAAATPDGFVRDFPHAFKPFNVGIERNSVETGEYREGIGGRYAKTRMETAEEVYARLGASPDRCSAGAYNRQCARPAADPIHEASSDTRA